MRRDTDSLRAAAGRVGDADLEAALAAATQAWPDGQAPVQALRFEQGKLTLVVSSWSADQSRTLPRAPALGGLERAGHRGPAGVEPRRRERQSCDMSENWLARLQPLRERAGATWRARPPRDRLALTADGPGARRVPGLGAVRRAGHGARCAARRRNSTARHPTAADAHHGRRGARSAQRHTGAGRAGRPGHQVGDRTTRRQGALEPADRPRLADTGQRQPRTSARAAGRGAQRCARATARGAADPRPGGYSGTLVLSLGGN